MEETKQTPEEKGERLATALTEYVNQKHTQEECTGFIDGFNAYKDSISGKTSSCDNCNQMAERNRLLEFALEAAHKSLCTYGEHPIIDFQVKQLLNKQD